MNHNFLFQLFRSEGIPLPVMEHRFDEKRRWRFDYAWPEQKVAVEVEGGVYTKGRHTRPAGFIADAEKYNQAAIQGWTLLRFTPSQMVELKTLKLIKSALE